MALYKLTEKVIAKLGLTDEGKVDKFMGKLVKADERIIAQLEANKKAYELQYDIDLQDLKDKLEDAQEALEAAYTDIEVDDIQSNADMDSFAVDYRAAIKQAADNVEYYSKKIEKLKESYTKLVEEINEQIAKRKAFIDKISK